MRWDMISAAAIVAVAIVAAGAMNRYSAAPGASAMSVWVVDGLTGEARLCFLMNHGPQTIGVPRSDDGCVSSGAAPS
jgi:hypothetical protein